MQNEVQIKFSSSMVKITSTKIYARNKEHLGRERHIGRKKKMQLGQRRSRQQRSPLRSPSGGKQRDRGGAICGNTQTLPRCRRGMAVGGGGLAQDSDLDGALFF